jgi:hypothetical protein
MTDIRARLSTLWIVVMLNMIYADILSFLDAAFLRGLTMGHADGVRVTWQLQLGAAVIVEIPILMVLLARTLTPPANRRVHLVAVPLTAAFIVGGGSTRPHYMLIAAVELVLLAVILRTAWRLPAEGSGPGVQGRVAGREVVPPGPA